MMTDDLSSRADELKAKITDEDLFLKKLETSQAKTIGILESKIALYQSYLHSDGARYEVLQEWHT